MRLPESTLGGLNFLRNFTWLKSVKGKGLEQQLVGVGARSRILIACARKHQDTSDSPASFAKAYVPKLIPDPQTSGGIFSVGIPEDDDLSSWIQEPLLEG